MPQYAFRCDCTATIPVGIAQAGSSVRCEQCSKLMEVPGTKVLRTLPILEDVVAGAVPKAGFAQRFLPALLLAIAALSLTTAGVLAKERWFSPIEFGHTEEEFFGAFREDALRDPPARVWDHWKYLVESGLPVHQPPDYFVINQYFERRKPWLIGSSILGALSLGTFLVLTFGQSKGRTGSNGRTGPSA